MGDDLPLLLLFGKSDNQSFRVCGNQGGIKFEVFELVVFIAAVSKRVARGKFPPAFDERAFFL